MECYAFAEVFAEKLRALGQRTRPRDLYDVVNLHRRHDLRDERELVERILHEKCAFKQVAVPTLAAVTQGTKTSELRSDWEAMLAHQLPALPPVEEFLKALEGVFAWLDGEEDADQLDSIPIEEDLDATWVAPSTLTRWPAGAPLEQIRFAGANRLLVELRYNGTTRLIEPYALYRSQAGDLLVVAIKPVTREVRTYRVDRIEGVRVSETPFIPQYAIELSDALPVRTGLRRPRTHV